MMKSIFALLCLLSAATAFQPLPTLTPGRLIAGSSSSGRTTTLADFVLNAAAEEEKDGESAVSASADGTYYDDELEPAPQAGISDTMKERLLREASTGMDSDVPQNNVILYISAAIAVLVILGGSGILY